MDTSIQSKRFKTPQWKARKKEQHMANQTLRAELHAEKASKSRSEDRFLVQQRVDAISKKG